jgi:hypothetical protein
MALRIHVGDDDLRRICPEFESELAALADSWPKDGRGRDGVLSDVATDGTTATLTSAQGNFKHQRGHGAAAKPGTLVILFGIGFYHVKTVLTNTSMVIEQDAGKPSMSFTLAARGNVQYQAGGFAPQILDAYEEVYHMPGMCPVVEVVEEALDRARENELVHKAIYIPDGWRGADAAIKWGALRLVLFMLQRTDDSVYAEKRDLADKEWEAKVNALDFVYFEPATEHEPMNSLQFTR